MKNRDLDALIRMAFEAERLDGEAVPVRHSHPRRSARTIRIAPWAIGLAAAILVVALNRGPSVPDSVRTGRGVVGKTHLAGVTVCHLPSMDDAPTRVETFQPNVTESTTLVAILRTWSTDCDCLAWRLHEWRDGSLVTDVSPGDALNIELASADQPSIQQVLLLAFAPNRRTLVDATHDEASELLDCLNSRAMATGPDIEAATYASAVSACLPPDVMVISQPYVARK